MRYTNKHRVDDMSMVKQNDLSQISNRVIKAETF